MNAWELQAEYFNTRTRLIIWHFSLVQSSHSQPLHTMYSKKELILSANIFLATFVLKTGSPRFQIRFAFPRISKNMQMKLFVWQKKLQLFFQYNQWRSHVVRRLLHRILLSRFLRLFSSKKLSDQNTIFNLEIMWIINHKTMTRSFDVNLYVITLLATPTAQVIFDWIYAI